MLLCKYTNTSILPKYLIDSLIDFTFYLNLKSLAYSTLYHQALLCSAELNLFISNN